MASCVLSQEHSVKNPLACPGLLFYTVSHNENCNTTGWRGISDAMTGIEKQRKDENTLVVIGGGVIAFGVWSVVRTVMEVILRMEELQGMSGMAGMTGLERLAAEIIMWVVVAILVGVDMSIRLFIGLSARSEGMGRKKGQAYVAVAGILAVFYVVIWLAEMAGFHGSEQLYLSQIAAMLLDFSSSAVLVELVFTAVRVKRARKLRKEGDA